MGDPKAVIAALVLVLATAPGCSWVLLQWREPGHRHRDFPDAVAAEYHCDKRPLPFFELEKSELVPNRVKAGSEFNQRLVYVLCPERPTAVVPGVLHTRILFEGRTIVSESLPEKLRPGRWVLDSFVHLPEDASPGLYAMDVHFESAAGQLRQRVDFVVREP